MAVAPSLLKRTLQLPTGWASEVTPRDQPRTVIVMFTKVTVHNEVIRARRRLCNSGTLNITTKT
ncbi:hypothetical protein NP493_246g01032 [Ridgeia piscesae]|uniref:Uncharacterized protein n=1 Tax=Ridgeia piscesae TaxID=27915 RepID=A0AAD9NZ05_RIDPI|nr:hypothetical protein NP493_246g01032 [Ridgeia piscesae]